MNTCEQCGKQMATRGGLEIHMELVHPTSAPSIQPSLETIPAAGGPAADLPTRAAQRAAPSAPTIQWHVPHFLHTVDPTVPLTALLVLALLFAGLVAALHRGSGHPPVAVGAQVAVPAAQAPPVAVDAAADQRQAQSLVLTQLDYPDGWTIAPHDFPPAAQAQNDRLLASCLGLPDPATTRTADAAGPDGHETGVVTTTTRVLVFRTAQQASADFAALGGPTAISCLKEEITRTLAGSGVPVRDVGIGRFAVSSGSVPNVALHCEVAADDGQGGTGVLEFDAVFMQQGRVEAELAVVSGDGQFSPDTEQTLVTRLAHKVANA